MSSETKVTESHNTSSSPGGGSLATTGPGSHRFQTLDAIRGFAALSVVVYHAMTEQLRVRDLVSVNPAAASVMDWIAYVLCWGSLGVPVFFMISGYCISAAADNHVRRGYTLERFLKRRLVRIYPPYWACLAVCVLLSVLPATKINVVGLSLTQWMGNLSLTETYRNYYVSPETTRLILGSAWTLCYEEQFYLLTAAVLFWAPQWLFRVYAVITAFVILNTYNLNIGPLRKLGDLNLWQINVDNLLIDRSWLFFATGIGLYRFRTAVSAWRYVFPALLLVFAWWEIRQLDWYTYRYSSRVFTIATALVLCCIGAADKNIRSYEVFRPLFWLGTRSYSIYLMHMPIVFLVIHIASRLGIVGLQGTLTIVVPAATALSLLAGHGFYMLVERYFLPQQTPDRLQTSALA